MGKSRTDTTGHPNAKKINELRAFVFITTILFPLISVVLVGGYGFAIWAFQLLFGPPTY